MNQLLTLRRFALAIAIGVVAGAVVLVAAAYGDTSSEARTPKNALVALGNTGLGRILVDAHGRTLYVFEKDRNGMSACGAACAKYWPPLASRAKPHAGKGVRSSLLGITKRRQVTYAGHPLYTFVGDKSAGATSGEGLNNFGAEWYALAASGRTVKPSQPSSGGYGPGYGGW